MAWWGQEIILLNDSPTFKNYMQNAHVCKFAPLLISVILWDQVNLL